MLQVITGNISTIIVSIVLCSVVLLIIKNLYHDKKTGKSSCGGGCSGCTSSSLCHLKKEDLIEQYTSGSR